MLHLSSPSCALLTSAVKPAQRRHLHLDIKMLTLPCTILAAAKKDQTDAKAEPSKPLLHFARQFLQLFPLPLVEQLSKGQVIPSSSMLFLCCKRWAGRMVYHLPSQQANSNEDQEITGFSKI